MPDSRQYEVPFSLKGLPHVPNFVARDQEMNSLEENLLPKPTRAIHQKVFVLHGPGGIGKTQLAIEFVQRSQKIFRSIFWLNGDSRERVRQSLAEIAQQLPKGQIPDSCRNFSKSSFEKLDEIIKNVLKWFNQPENNRWLLVFDNVDRDNSSEVDDPQSYDVKDFFPEANHGSILITTRLRQLRRHGKDRQLEGMSDQQAAEVLRCRTGRSIKGCDRIVKKIGGVPLALALAGSYIHRTNTSEDDYLLYYAEAWEKLHHSKTTRLKDYSPSILSTYTISYEYVQCIDTNAAKMFDLFAHLDPSDIWYSLFTSILERTIAKSLLPTWFSRSVRSESEFIQKIQILLDCSLIEKRCETSSYAIHPIIHDWCFNLSRVSQDEIASLATSVIGSACFSIDDSADWQHRKGLIDHCSHLHFCIEKNPQDFARNERWETMVCFSYSSIGNFTSSHGRLKESEEMYLRALTENKGDGGADASTFKIINNLGLLYDKQGNMKKAEEMYLRALAGKEKVGDDNLSSTLETAHNLGVFYKFEGNIEKAEEMFLRALRGKEKNLGIDHKSTLKTIHQLGSMYIISEKVKEAEKLYLQALAAVEKNGSADPTSSIFEIMNSLGVLYFGQNKMKEAEELFLRALTECEKFRDPDAKLSFDTRYNLGVLYDEQSRFQDAAQQLNLAIEGLARTLGSEHRQTIQAVNLLETVHEKMGNMRGKKEVEQDEWRGEEMESMNHAAKKARLT